MSDCPCQADTYAPECRAISPSSEAMLLLGEAICGWGYCTRSEGHEGDHVRCGGMADQFHSMERWPQVLPDAGR